MKKLVVISVIVILGAVLTWWIAVGGPGDVKIWGGSYTLGEGKEIMGDLSVFGGDAKMESGSKVYGDVTVFGGNATLSSGSKVYGDVTVFGGNLTVQGEVKGDVVAWGGNVNLTDESRVLGDVVSVGGNVRRAEGSDLRGEMMSRTGVTGWPMLPFMPGMMHRPPRFWDGGLLHRVGLVFRGAFGTLTTIVLGVLVVVFLPRHTETVAETMLKAPVYSLVNGAAALVVSAAAFLVVSLVAALLALTICLAPVSLLLFIPFLIVGVALLFGWIAAGLLLGTKVLRALSNDKEPSRVLAVALGITLLSLVSSVPCVGWALSLAVITWSLGAVVYSLFGTRAYDEPAPRLWSSGARYDPRMDRL